MTVLSLTPRVTVAEEIRTSIIALLEKALAEARDGNVSSIVIIALHPNGEWSDWQSSTEQLAEMIGRLEIAKHRRIISLQAETSEIA